MSDQEVYGPRTLEACQRCGKNDADYVVLVTTTDERFVAGSHICHECAALNYLDETPGKPVLDVMRAQPVVAVCDFCSMTGVRWTLHSRTSVTESVTGVVAYGNSPDWAVCEGCHPFVEARDIDGLARRVVRIAVEHETIPADKLLMFRVMFDSECRQTWAPVFANFLGIEPYDPNQPEPPA